MSPPFMRSDYESLRRSLLITSGQGGQAYYRDEQSVALSPGGGAISIMLSAGRWEVEDVRHQTFGRSDLRALQLLLGTVFSSLISALKRYARRMRPGSRRGYKLEPMPRLRWTHEPIRGAYKRGHEFSHSPVAPSIRPGNSSACPLRRGVLLDHVRQHPA
jgi:hypothetical protein